MKKYLKTLAMGLMISMLAISISACSSGVDLSKEDNSSAITSTKVEDGAFGLNQTATTNSLKITAKKFEESKGKSVFKPDAGNVYVGVNFEIENISDETQNISSLLLFDAYADDAECKYAIVATTVFGEGTLDGEVLPGEKLVGWYAMEVPKKWEKISIEFKPEILEEDKVKFVFAK